MMWNIFRTKQGVLPGDKQSEEDPEMLVRQLKARFEQKMKELSNSIK